MAERRRHAAGICNFSLFSSQGEGSKYPFEINCVLEMPANVLNIDCSRLSSELGLVLGMFDSEMMVVWSQNIEGVAHRVSYMNFKAIIHWFRGFCAGQYSC